MYPGKDESLKSSVLFTLDRYVGHDMFVLDTKKLFCLCRKDVPHGNYHIEFVYRNEHLGHVNRVYLDAQ